MGKEVFRTLIVTAILFVILAPCYFLAGAENWFYDTINLVIPLGILFFVGDGIIRKIENR